VREKRTSRTIRLVKTRVHWQDEEPIRASRAAFKGPINPLPLLVFLAVYKLESLRGRCDDGFEMSGSAGSHAASLHHLMENCKKKNFWLTIVFGSEPHSADDCRVKHLIEAPERHEQFVARLCTDVLDPRDVALSLNGRSADTEDNLRVLLTDLGAGDAIADVPVSQQSEIPLYWGFRPAAHEDIRKTLMGVQDELIIAGIALTTISDVLTDPRVVDALANEC
jgi:hypothetical protein